MAIFRTGAVVGAISGKLGGVVFVAGKGSPVVRRSPIVRTRTSPYLQTARARFYNLRRHWSTLTALQQDAWRTRARDTPHTNRLGQTSPLSGFALFIRQNTLLRNDSEDIEDEPSAAPVGPPPRITSVVFSASGGYIIAVLPPKTFDSALFYLYGWPFLRDYDSPESCRVVFLRRVFAPSANVNLRPEWEEHFGPLVENQRFCFAVATQNADFGRSAQVFVKGIVAA